MPSPNVTSVRMRAKHDGVKTMELLTFLYPYCFIEPAGSVARRGRWQDKPVGLVRADGCTPTFFEPHGERVKAQWLFYIVR